jgi:DoxX-like protein
MKTIALYGLQMLVGLVALAAGYAKLTGMGFMAEPFAMIGLGKSFLMIAGTVEILAGLCLLFPRSGVVGALLLTTVMVGTMGASLGTAIANRGEATQLVSQTTFRATVRNDASVMPAVVVKKSQGWDI